MRVIVKFKLYLTKSCMPHTLLTHRCTSDSQLYSYKPVGVDIRISLHKDNAECVGSCIYTLRTMSVAVLWLNAHAARTLAQFSGKLRAPNSD